MTVSVKLYAALLLILVAVLLINQNRFVPLESRPHLTTVGTAEVSVTPSEARIYGTFVNKASDQKTANKDNGEAVNTIVGKLKTLGISKDDIATTSISIYPEYDYSNYRTGEPKITGYRASTTVTVKLKQTDLADKVLATMTEAKAENVSGPTYSLSDDDIKAYQAEAQAKALVDAQAQADALVIGMKRRLGPILAVVPTSSGAPTPSPFLTRAASADLATTAVAPPERSSAGTQTITATVTVTYSLR